MKKPIISERPNLFEPNVYIGIYVEIDGNPPVELMKNAIQKAFQSNELTMSKVVIDELGQAYYQKLKQSGCKVIITENDWKSILAENEKQPFAINSGELMRVFINENGKLFLMAHHLVGDGKSIITFLQDVLMVLAGNEPQYKQGNILTKEFLHRKAKLSFLARKYVSYLNKVWGKERHHFSWGDYDAIHKQYWEGHTSNILTHTFTEKETKRIKDMARALNVTVNSYLISSILCVRKDFNIVGIPASIREDNQSMSNQVGGIALNLKNVKKTKMNEKVKMIHKRIQKKLKSPSKKYFVLLFMSEVCPTLIDAVLLTSHGQIKHKIAENAAYAWGYQGMKKRDLGVSNLGVINMQADYGRYRVDNLIFIPPSISYTQNIIGVSTINERITITYHSMKKDEENSWFQELVCLLCE